jgi:NADH:ubiquinone oxidoreductase subunit 2 (subunit N)
MSGLPPFLGFWAKVSIIIFLLNNSEFILAIIAFSCGLFLMYFYLQNYRFNTNVVKSFSRNTIYLTKTAGFIFLIVSSGVFINFNLFDLW